MFFVFFLDFVSPFTFSAQLLRHDFGGLFMVAPYSITSYVFYYPDLMGCATKPCVLARKFEPRLSGTCALSSSSLGISACAILAVIWLQVVRLSGKKIPVSLPVFGLLRLNGHSHIATSSPSRAQSIGRPENLIETTMVIAASNTHL